MKLTNWFKSKNKCKFHLDESKNPDYNIFHTCYNFSNTTNNRNNIQYRYINESSCNSGIINSSNKCNVQVEENSNRFFRTHTPNITDIISQAFGNDSYYSYIYNMIDYRLDLPKLVPPMINNITYAIKHLETGYKDLNSLRKSRGENKYENQQYRKIQRTNRI